MGDASPHASNTSHSQRKVSEASVESESYQTHQLTLERMLNPGVFFQSVRETRKHNAGFQKLTPLMTLQQVSFNFCFVLDINHLITITLEWCIL